MVLFLYTRSMHIYLESSLAKNEIPCMHLRTKSEWHNRVMSEVVGVRPLHRCPLLTRCDKLLHSWNVYSYNSHVHGISFLFLAPVLQAKINKRKSMFWYAYLNVYELAIWIILLEKTLEIFGHISFLVFTKLAISPVSLVGHIQQSSKNLQQDMQLSSCIKAANSVSIRN